MYHARCASEWVDARARARGGGARGGEDARAPCPTCKREFGRRDYVTIYLDDAVETAGVGETSDGGGKGRRRSSGEGEGRVADLARALRRERERAREALDALAAVEVENRELKRVKADDDALRERVSTLKREVNAANTARRILAGELQTERERNQVAAARLAVLEDKERVEREVSAMSSSLGEREMLKRLEGSDPRAAMTTLVRNLCAKNKQVASQKEQYDELARRMRVREGELKALESKMEAYRAAAEARDATRTAPAANVATPAEASFPAFGGRAASARAWGVDDPSDLDPSIRPRAEGGKKRKPLRSGDDELMRRLAPPKKPAAPIDLLSDGEDADDVLADILNEVDERVERKRRAAASLAPLGAKKRPAGSFIAAKSANGASTTQSNGTFIRHGADGRGGRGKFFAI